MNSQGAARVGAVFLSYAHEDADVVQRIAAALHGEGVEVWFDRHELRGGDAWDAKIRRQIKECALFVPVVSASTQARREGYFRIEWRLAAQRTHAMAEGIPFLLPLLIDATPEPAVLAPSEFREVQWTRLPDRGSPAEFCSRVKSLLGSNSHSVRAVRGASTGVAADRPTHVSKALPAAKTIAVLAFANLSQDPENEYFSDGISEELLNVLAKIPGLRVTARTSSFYFKGKNVPVPRIAQELGVGYVVEGSVRRAGGRVRITAQLIDATEDYHLWSDTFDRELKDIFAVQDEIAGLIAGNLQLKLAHATAQVAPVHPEAYRLCLEGRRGLQIMSAESIERAEVAFRHALAIAPDFAPAFVGLAQAANIRIAITGATPTFRVEELIEGEQRARDALRLDPQNGDAHTGMALVEMIWGRLAEAGVAYQRAVELGASPDALASTLFPLFWLRMGRPDRGVTEMKRICRLDPFSWLTNDLHGVSVLHAGFPAEALAWFERAEQLGAAPVTFAHHSIALGRLGRHDEAIGKAREALVRARNPVWGESFNALAEGYAAWGLAAAGAREEAEQAALRIWQGPEHLRFNAGIPFLLVGRSDDGVAVLGESWPRYVGFLLAFLHDHPETLSESRTARLLEDLDAVRQFEALKSLRRGDTLA